jgi:hypothetical protein
MIKLFRKLFGILLLLIAASFSLGIISAVFSALSGALVHAFFEFIISFCFAYGFYFLGSKVYPGSIKIF